MRVQEEFTRQGKGKKGTLNKRVQHVQTHGDEKEHGTVGAAMARRAEDKAEKVYRGHCRVHKGPRTSF